MEFCQNINLSKNILSYKRSVFEIIFFSILCFTISFFLVHPQWAVGTVVNAILFRVAITQKGLKFLLPIVILPSLGAILSGLIFGTPVLNLFIFAPLIWLGNFLYILINKSFILKNRLNPVISLASASIVKGGILFMGALIAVYVFNFPNILLTAMGLIQVLTAVFGGLLAISYQEIENMFFKQV
ncbi:hypothetical protein KO317_02260 [Candidatus Micrarchaeota archaeon]|nr:hypothetical protein [Candidatus Micrarchaeota archaeon]